MGEPCKPASSFIRSLSLAHSRRAAAAAAMFLLKSQATNLRNVFLPLRAYVLTVHSTQRICALSWSVHLMVVTIFPLTPEGKSESDLFSCAPTASGHGSGQQPPAWSAQRSSTVGEKGMPLKVKP